MSGGKHRSLYVGDNYHGTPNELHGCINDVNNLRHLLEELGFNSSESKVLVDDPEFPGRTGNPTKDEILQGLDWLVAEAAPGDNLIFHYSGHGTRGQLGSTQRDAIVPKDYEAASVIFDKDLWSRLCARLPAGSRLTAIFDCCHSGTVLDLPYCFYPQSTGKDFSQVSSNQCEADIFCISGCRDDQTSS